MPALGAGNVLSVTTTGDRIYRHSGFSDTILDSFAPTPGSDPTAVGFDGTNILSCDYIQVRHYKHDGFSTDILDSYTPVQAWPAAITWDGTHVLSNDFNSSTGRHYKHSGFSNTVLDSFIGPDTIGPGGMGWDGINCVLTSGYLDKAYITLGFSGTITDSFSAPSAAMTGCSWDGTDFLSGNYTSPARHYKHSGFTSTIKDTYTAPAANTGGAAWDVVQTPSGWGHIIDTVAAASMAKVNTIAKVSIAEINET